MIYGEARHYVPAVMELTKLEGVSFPIATLILAEHDPVNIPYFTEGVYRWLREDEAREGTWDRKVDYIVRFFRARRSLQLPYDLRIQILILYVRQMKQYRVLMTKTAELRSRLRRESGFEVTALDIERVGRQINEYALERRKKSAVEEDDMLLRPLGTWSSKTKRLGPPLPENQRVPAHPPKKKKGSEAAATTGNENEEDITNPFVEQPRTVTILKAFKEPKRTVDDGRWRPY